MSNKIKRLNYLINLQDKQILNVVDILNISEDVIKDDIKLPKKGKRGRPKKIVKD